MTVPLSDTQLAAIRERARGMIADKVVYASVQYAEDYSLLLAEVERLRAVVEDHQGEVVRYDADHERLSAELSAWQSAQDAVMALTEDVNTPVTLAQVAKAHAHGLLAGRRAAAAKED